VAEAGVRLDGQKKASRSGTLSITTELDEAVLKVCSRAGEFFLVIVIKKVLTFNPLAGVTALTSWAQTGWMA
jgi:hypothetical protein